MIYKIPAISSIRYPSRNSSLLFFDYMCVSCVIFSLIQWSVPDNCLSTISVPNKRLFTAIGLNLYGEYDVRMFWNKIQTGDWAWTWYPSTLINTVEQQLTNILVEVLRNEVYNANPNTVITSRKVLEGIAQCTTTSMWVILDQCNQTSVCLKSQATML